MKRKMILFLAVISINFSFFSCAMENNINHESSLLAAIANNNYTSVKDILKRYTREGYLQCHRYESLNNVGFRIKNALLNRHITINQSCNTPWYSRLQSARNSNTNIESDTHLLTPLSFAIALGMKEMAAFLYKELCVDTTKNALDAAIVYNPTMIPEILSWGVPLTNNIIIRAVEQDSVLALQELVKCGAKLTIKINREQSCLLHLASSKNNCLRVAQFLLDSGIDINEPDVHGCTPLHEAAGSHREKDGRRFLVNYGPNSKALDFLLNHGADVKALTKDSRSVTECLDPHNLDDMKKLICSGAPLPKATDNAAYNSLMNTPLLHSIFSEIAIDKELLSYIQLNSLKRATGNNLVQKQKSLYGLTPLHFSVITGNKNLVDLLLDYKKSPKKLKKIIAHIPLFSRFIKKSQKPIVDVNCRDDEGRTPLMWAARLDYAYIYHKLRDHGAQRMMTDKKGNIALNYAANYGSMHVFEMMMANEEPNPLKELLDKEY